ncbi:AAA family ATPase [Candidatus Microgenomates bacterium]|nr:AAA family ATPase [Candidatus Microgenomates bacterium]
MSPSSSATQGELEKIKAKLQGAKLPPELLEKANAQIERIQLTLKYGGNFAQFDITDKYIDWITHLPWLTATQDTLEIKHAKEILDKNHFGLEKIKARVLEYLSVLIMQRKQGSDFVHRAPILFFVGLAGTGKTTFAISLAEALGKKFVRIPFGGLSSALDLRGQSKTSPESEPGQVIRGLREAGANNPVILLDELDRITPEARGAIMGVLIELLDPGQNKHFTDYFIDYPFDLSNVIFVATANNTAAISTAVMDRLEVIQMPSYTDAEKINIAKNYVLPRYLRESGLGPQAVKFDDAIWPKITRPLGFDSGIRTLERTIDGIIRRAAYRIVSGQAQTFFINDSNLKEFM